MRAQVKSLVLVLAYSVSVALSSPLPTSSSSDAIPTIDESRPVIVNVPPEPIIRRPHLVIARPHAHRPIFPDVAEPDATLTEMVTETVTASTTQTSAPKGAQSDEKSHLEYVDARVVQVIRLAGVVIPQPKTDHRKDLVISPRSVGEEKLVAYQDQNQMQNVEPERTSDAPRFAVTPVNQLVGTRARIVVGP